MTGKRVELRIGEVVLEGVTPSERDRLLASLERELASQIAGGQRPRRSQAEIVAERPAGSNPSELGRGMARTIAKGGER